MRLAILFIGAFLTAGAAEAGEATTFPPASGAMAASAPASGVVAATGGDTAVKAPVITDARVQYTVENIYTEIKAKKMDRAELLFAAAKRGYPNACLYAGYMFDNGIGVKKNPEKAFAWFKSCAKNHPVAAYDLAVLYAEGRGTTKDMDKAVKWFKLSWPSLKGNTPQTAIRLAYYYLHKKDWSSAWYWADIATNVNNKKHGDYIMATILAHGYGRQQDIPTALVKANNAMTSYNPNGASLLAWIYGTGKTDEPKEKALEMACAYESIAAMMDARLNRLIRYCGGDISAETRQRGENFAKNYMATQKAPVPMDFTSTLDGREAQFKF